MFNIHLILSRQAARAVSAALAALPASTCVALLGTAAEKGKPDRWIHI